MHRSIHSLSVVLALAALPACLPTFAEKGSGVAGRETRTVPAFDKIAIGGSADVVVTIGTPQSVTVACDDNLLARVRTEVDDGELSIELANGSYQFRHDLTVTIVVPQLRAVEIRGSGDLVATGIDEAEFRGGIRGSGELRASGRAERAVVEIRGSGGARLADLSARTVEVSIAGSGEVETAAVESLSVEIRGSGEVRYRGEPKITRDIAGSGEIVPLR
ncbi:MAG: head GIN domain-containing protein [Planctomycetota bacterium]